MFKHRSLARGIFGLAVFTLALLSGPRSAPGQAGVQIVKNPRRPVAVAGQPSSLTLKEDLVIGLTGGPEGDLFAELRSVGVDDQENIWTLDSEDVKVRIFDKTGKPVITFGKKGQGPKELLGPFRMVVRGDGTAAFMDNTKLAFYGRDGQCRRELLLSRRGSSRMKFDPKGCIFLDAWEYGPDPSSKTMKQTWKITKYDADLKLLKTFPIAEASAALYAVDFFSPTLYFHVAADGRLIWIMTSKYEFNVLDPDGRTMLKIIKDYEPRKISATEEKNLMKERYGDRQVPAGIKINIPPAYLPLSYILVDDDTERIYARTTEPDGKGGTWIDVFNPDGRYIARTSLPEDELVFVAKKDNLYVILPEDEEGRPLVKRYAMIWK